MNAATGSTMTYAGEAIRTYAVTAGQGVTLVKLEVDSEVRPVRLPTQRTALSVRCHWRREAPSDHHIDPTTGSYFCRSSLSE